MTSADLAPFQRPSKVQDWHLDRIAVVYVRQSSVQQVLENRESTQRQYALVDRAIACGWPRERVLVIDEDQGKSGSTSEGRPGFQRLLAEVGLDHVGLILGIEMSRLARSCKDWHQLLELCAIFRTLLGDQDGFYDPTDPNDRLLLGLKGTMSEAELHVLRGRLRQGVLNKARRGELFVLPPIGYVRSPFGGIELDPDEQVRGAVEYVFNSFARLGSIRAVTKAMLDKGVSLGVRIASGPQRGQIEWRPAALSTVAKMLKHPIYAGTYVFGRTRTDPRRRGRDGAGQVKAVTDPQHYHAHLPGRCPAYITAEQYEANQDKLRTNRARTESVGAVREGPSLLAGLVRCSRCGRRMMVAYSGSSRTQLRYSCANKPSSNAKCRHQFLGKELDQAVATEVLRALAPGAVELSAAAVEDVIRERTGVDRQWQQRLERARLAAERIERQYQAVEPENRLVARTLEQRWNEALLAVRQLEEEYHRFQQTQPKVPTAAELDQLRKLAEDLPALWHAPTTQAIDHQRIIRIVVQEVCVTTEQTNDLLTFRITWMGGDITEHQARRRVKRFEHLHDFSQLVARLGELRSAAMSSDKIAEQLNKEGFRCPYDPRGFQKKNVQRLMRRHLSREPSSLRQTLKQLLGPDEWLASELVEKLEVSRTTIHDWMKLGWIEYRRVPRQARRLYACWANAAELNRLRELARSPRHWYDPALPAWLTTPRAKPPKRKSSCGKNGMRRGQERARNRL
jgi:DNA invertase Pin-like site-specific DNA recombinase